MTIKSHSIDISQLMSVSDVDNYPSSEGAAAILVPLIRKGDDWHLVLTKRAESLRHHPGETAFPGGKWEEGESYPLETALRESEEEIGLLARNVDVLGCLAPLNTRYQTQVVSVVGVIHTEQNFLINGDEIAQIFTVPVNFFLQDRRLRTDIFPANAMGKNAERWVPVYEFQGHEIWGFTAAVIVQLLERCFGASISRKNLAPERHW